MGRLRLMGETTTWHWELATDAAEVHRLVCACDEHQARLSGTQVPARRSETTEQRVETRSVHVLRHGSEAAATFTLVWEPPFDASLDRFPPASRPAYLQRLAVSPDWLGRDALVGARCLRRAVELATSQGADAIRAEANPDLTDVRELLRLFGFRQCGPPEAAAGLARVYVQRALGPAGAR